MKYKLIWLGLLILGCLSCNNKKAYKGTVLKLDRTLLDSLSELYGGNIAILSCLKCDCFRQEYNKAFAENRKIPARYNLMTDSQCTKLAFPAIQLPQHTIERISEDMYNLVLIKRSASGYTYKIASIKESRNIQGVADRFFKD